MSFQSFGATNNVTNVDCQKQVRSWRLLRYLIQLLIPTCNSTLTQNPKPIKQELTQNHSNYNNSNNYPNPTFTTSSSKITGTIFGFRHGKIRFCIQKDSKSVDPILLLEFAVPTCVLAREMQGGILRIALESSDYGYSNSSSNNNNSCSLLSMPLWSVYFNGRKAGYAVKRRPSKVDREALKLMGSVVAGAGVISGKELDRDDDDELMYLRANFARVSGSSVAESFHLIDPDDGSNKAQQLSIFFFRST